MGGGRQGGEDRGRRLRGGKGIATGRALFPSNGKKLGDFPNCLSGNLAWDPSEYGWEGSRTSSRVRGSSQRELVFDEERQRDATGDSFLVHRGWG